MEQPYQHQYSYKIEYNRFYGHNYEQSDFLTFDSANDLENRLGLIIKRFRNLPLPDNFVPAWFRNLINPSLSLTISKDADDTPEFLEKTLRHIGKKYPNINTIVVKNNPNNNNDNNEDALLNALKARLDNVITKREQEIYRRASKIRNAIIIPALLGVAILALGAAPLVALHFIIKEAITGILLIAGRQWYLDYFTPTKQQINEVTNHRVITALEKGAQSIHWGGYFLSYFSYSALLYPGYFAGGLNTALQNKQTKLDLIHEKYANRML